MHRTGYLVSAGGWEDHILRLPRGDGEARRHDRLRSRGGCIALLVFAKADNMRAAAANGVGEVDRVARLDGHGMNGEVCGVHVNRAGSGGGLGGIAASAGGLAAADERERQDERQRDN